jgi:nucleotide-binding universal stress UspA family protein
MLELTKVLAGSDGGDPGAAAITTGAALAGRAEATFEVVSVLEVLLLPVGVEAEVYEGDFAADLRKKVKAQMEKAGVAGATLHVRSGLAAPIITQQAEDAGASLLVVGANQKPAVARFLVGSTAERVIRMAHRPVLVATEERRDPFRRVLAAVDLSGQSTRVMEAAAAIAQVDGAELRVLYVQDLLTPMLLEAALFDAKEVRHYASEQFARTVSQLHLPSELMVSREIREGHAGHAILDEAEDWKADLIVVGTHGFGFFNRLMLGSTSIHVLRHGHRSTLIVPRGEAEEE